MKINNYLRFIIGILLGITLGHIRVDGGIYNALFAVFLLIIIIADLRKTSKK